MNSEELRNLDGADPIKQAEYLSNFKHMFTAGRQLQSVYRIITPDNLDNINEMSSISSWLETEERYLTGVESNIIEGAEQFVRILDMLPKKSTQTDTVQLDMTSTILDKIAKEEKKSLKMSQKKELILGNGNNKESNHQESSSHSV